MLVVLLPRARESRVISLHSATQRLDSALRLRPLGAVRHRGVRGGAEDVQGRADGARHVQRGGETFHRPQGRAAGARGPTAVGRRAQHGLQRQQLRGQGHVLR